MTSQGNKYPINQRLYRCDFGTISSSKSSCSVCFNAIHRDSNVDYLESCDRCNKTICHECLIDHRMELKKNIIRALNQCCLLMRKNQGNAEEIMNKLENMKIHIDFSALELIDQVCCIFIFILRFKSILG